MNGIIIGGGIAGLACAHALNQVNISTRVYESTPTLKAVGAGLVLGTNAMQILDRLDLAKAVIQEGNELKSFEITNHQLKALQTVFQENTKRRFGFYGTAIHRAKLHQVLVDRLKDGQLELGHQLAHLEQDSSNSIAHFANGQSQEADFFIGADGIHSKLREVAFPAVKMRAAQQYCWRGITSLPSNFPDPHKAIESWGNQRRFGLIPIGDQKLYWFAVVTDHQWQIQEKQSDQEALIHAFKDFHPLIHTVLQSTPASAILRNDIYDFAPIPNWYKENICLIGDAAHAMTPNMGQGACQAIEDAYFLAKAAEENTDIQQAFLNFQKIRKPRVDRIVNQSLQIGKMAHIGIGQGLRNWIMRQTPSRMAEKQLDFLYTV
jgi:2-polyprenyl-6-methoxyphenol hydroxylase-like FAD-dependent oxidoreductase